jgi:hypothetical protein
MSKILKPIELMKFNISSVCGPDLRHACTRMRVGWCHQAGGISEHHRSHLRRALVVFYVRSLRDDDLHGLEDGRGPLQRYYLCAWGDDQAGLQVK